MKKVIVTTTIHSPTEAIAAFQKLPGWELVVVGDKKTPKDYKLERGIYVSPRDQERYDRRLSDAIGWNCIQRRNFGLLWAQDLEADVVALVDDDNVPLPGWGEDLLLGRSVPMDVYETELPAFDPVGATNYPHLWHRGYPLPLLARRRYGLKKRKSVRARVQADFWNGEPDVDAVCRMEHAPECVFEPARFPMAAGKLGPFNSQNTFLDAALLRDYFLFPGVGRMDDIWASFYVQARGARLAYGRPSVLQKRNPHDPLEDLRQEYLGYRHNLSIVRDVARDPEALLAYLPEKARRAFALYRKHFGHA